MDSARHGRAHVAHPLQYYWLRLLSVWEKSKISRAPHRWVRALCRPLFYTNIRRNRNYRRSSMSYGSGAASAYLALCVVWATEERTKFHLTETEGEARYCAMGK